MNGLAYWYHRIACKVGIHDLGRDLGYRPLRCLSCGRPLR